MEGTSTMDASHFATNSTPMPRMSQGWLETDSAPSQKPREGGGHINIQTTYPREKRQGVTLVQIAPPKAKGLHFHYGLSLPLALPNFCTFESRYLTFKEGWPKYLPGPNQAQLARAGFVYKGVGDRVECFCCGIGLKDWEWTDNAYAEHRRWSKDCPYAQLVG